MTPPPRKYQYDETLLYQGKYGEWFWSRLSPEARSYLKRPQCPDCHQTPRQSSQACLCVLERGKPAGWVNRESLAWRLQAACIGVDLETFFPANEALYNRRDAAWRKYCSCCEVSGACILFAADSKSIGIYGGRLFGKSHFKSGNPLGSGKPGRPLRQKVEQ